MVEEYFILNTTIEELKPDFYCFQDRLDLQFKISKVFLNENSKWEVTSSGTLMQCFYKCLEGDIKIEIVKPQKTRPFIFKLTILGGTNPLNEVARLCRINSWMAFNSKTLEYLNIDNPPQLIITDEEKKCYYDDYWEKFNAVQEEDELSKFDLEENQKVSKHKKKWWQFWNSK